MLGVSLLQRPITTLECLTTTRGEVLEYLRKKFTGISTGNGSQDNSVGNSLDVVGVYLKGLFQSSLCFLESSKVQFTDGL